MGSIFTVVQKIIRVIIPVLGAEHVTLGTFGHQISPAHIWIVPQYRTYRTVKEGKQTHASLPPLAETAKLLRLALSKEV